MGRSSSVLVLPKILSEDFPNYINNMALSVALNRIQFKNCESIPVIESKHAVSSFVIDL